jgi:hypothetical protein
MKKYLVLLFICITIQVLGQKIELDTLQDSYEDHLDDAPVLVAYKKTGTYPYHEFYYQYNYSIPLKGTTEYTSKANSSFRGIRYQYSPNNKFSITIESSINKFDKFLERNTVNIGNTAVNSVVYRTLYLLPVTVGYTYYLKPEKATFRNYVEPSLGVVKTNYTSYYGLVYDEKKESPLQFGLKVGTKINFKKKEEVVADLSVKWQRASFAYDFISSINYVSFQANVGLRWWSDKATE